MIVSGQMRASTDELIAVAQHCRTTSDELSSELSRVVQRVDLLVSGSLTGRTSAALQSVFASINGNLTKMTSALVETADLLEQASRAYRAIDEEGAREIATNGQSDVLRALRPPDRPA